MHSKSDEIHIEAVTDAKQIAQTVNEVWQAQYPDDCKLNIWPEDFFNWQFLQTPAVHPAICLGAYYRDELLGVYCGDVWTVIDPAGDTERFTYLSCVSVRSCTLRYRASSKLLSAMRQWSADNGSFKLFGFVNPNESEMVGRRYWTTRSGLSFKFLEGSRQWQLLSGQIGASVNVEHSETADSQNCAAEFLLKHMSMAIGSKTRAIDWSLSRIRHQIRFARLVDFSYIVDGSDQALCSYYTMPSRSGSSVAYIDFLAASNGRRDLMRLALHDALPKIHAIGCKRIMTLGAPTNHEDDLLAMGFTPCMPSYTPMLGSWDAEPTFFPGARLALIYR